MAYRHEFGIIERIEEGKNYEYEPNKYNCVSVDGDFIDEIYHKGFGDKMKVLDTYVNNIETPYKDLGYYGVTLIPPSSLELFRGIILEENKRYKSREFEVLVEKILEAMQKDKWMIHYGV